MDHDEEDSCRDDGKCSCSCGCNIGSDSCVRRNLIYVALLAAALVAVFAVLYVTGA